MKPEDLRALLRQVQQGELPIEDAERKLQTLPFEDLGFARIDHHRHVRTGFPEVVYGPGKTVEQLARIIDSIFERGQMAVATRVDGDKAEAALKLMRPGTRKVATYEPHSRLLTAGKPLEKRGRGTIAVVSAGTSDRPVAEEAAYTAEVMGNEVLRINDVGVAGLHRILAVRDQLECAEVVIVVAGMEGALPSVVRGLISRPLIAVPTSVGFGTSFQGISALLGMLNSCAPGISVVNIDNGFGAGFAASLINVQRERSDD